MNGWGNKTKDELNEIRDKSTKTWNQKFLNGEIVPHKGKHSVETLEKMSILAIQRLELNPHIKWYDLNNLFKVQGMWELNVGLILLKKYPNLKRISLLYDGSKRYTPDFCIDENTFVEVKGWLRDYDIIKYKKFQLFHPEKKIYLIRNTSGKRNYFNFIKEKIKLEECEDLYEVLKTL